MSNLRAAVAAIAVGTGVPLEALNDRELLVAGATIQLPVLTGERAELLGIQGLLPTVPHGDDRDKLLWQVIAQSAPDPDGQLLDDLDLVGNLAGRIGLPPEAARIAAAALRDRFFSSKRSSAPSRRGKPDAPALLPVHASLPLNYRHAFYNAKKARVEAAGYTMFNGGVLPFLLWDASIGGPDEALIQSLLDVMGSDEELTALDRKFLQVALDGAPRANQRATAAELMLRHRDALEKSFSAAGGPFCEPSLALFKRDLETVLRTPLPRPERAEWLTRVLSLHLALRMYRVAVAVGGALDLAVAAAGQVPAPPGAAGCGCSGRDLEQLQTCPFAGAIRFRTGSGRYRRVHGTDGCRTAYIQIDRQRLLDLPATLVTRTLACTAWAALGGGISADVRDLQALSSSLNADADLRRVHGAACAAITAMHHNAWRKGAATLDEMLRAARIDAFRPGLHALREDVRRMRRKDLRHQSTDVVNQLVLAQNVGTGSIITRNGPSHGFFEVDEQMLLMLVRLICVDREVPLETFLRELRAYGLAPQDAQEQEALAATLERLGLLDRYSDAGEASFVRYA